MSPTQAADETATLSVYIPQDKLTLRPVERMQELARRRDRSINYLVVEAILQYLQAEENEDGRATATDTPKRPYLGVSEPGSHTSLRDAQDEWPERPEEDRASCEPPVAGPIATQHPFAQLVRFLRNLLGRVVALLGRLSSRKQVPESTGGQSPPSTSVRTKVIEHRYARFEIRLPPRTGGVPRPLRQSFAPYTELQIERLPDPRQGQTDPILETIREIVNVEGPVTVERVRRICANAAGLHRVGRVLRECYGEGISRGLRDGHFKSLSFVIEPGWHQTVLYIPGKSALVPRVPGPRSCLYDVPLPELGSLIRLTRKRVTSGGILNLRIVGLSPNEFLRKILQMYGIHRLTKKARKYMVAAEEARLGADMGVAELKDPGRRWERSTEANGIALEQ